MTGVVVRTIEQLKAVRHKREHPVIIIDGELAGDLISSGIVKFFLNTGTLQTIAEDFVHKKDRSPLFEVKQILLEYARDHNIVIEGVPGHKMIKIIPRETIRRDK
jgi:hypothetical protein